MVAAMVATLLVASACSDARDSQPGATVPPGGDVSSTSAPATTLDAEAYAVPEVIDQAYVQRVVSAYDKVLGDAIRILKRDGEVTERFLEHLVAIYTEKEFEFAQKVWFESVADGRVAKTRESPGDPVTSVVSLVRADPSCIVARAERDYLPTLVPGEEQVESDEDDYIVLVRKAPDRDPASLNLTPWAMAFDGFKKDSSAPTEACGA